VSGYETDVGKHEKEDTEPTMEVLTKQWQIAKLAEERPQESFTALNHYLDMNWMKEAFSRLRRASAAGVDGQSYRDEGTPQGGIISPLLSNIFLHEVLDKWFAHEVKVRLKGRAFLVRYADDFVMGFEYEEDARRVYAVLPKRFEKWGLRLHPEKTRLIPFARPRKGSGKQGPAEPSTFDFLGFTHYWGKTRKGGFAVRRKTARKRISRSLKAISQWMQKNRHRRVGEQWKTLVQKLRGHFGYYGITGNGEALERFREEVKRLWHKWLDRRSRNRGGMSWQRFAELMKRFPFPPARVVHSIYAAKS
jgi:hypothetical protein